MVVVLILELVLFAPIGGGQEAEKAETQVRESMEVVYSPEDFRFRSNDVAPTLVYKQDFFQRFEPVSVGDILKRIPGISGSGDAGEFTRPQLRGIAPSYTQILINGRRIPGAENDRTVYVDRIPAHRVERLEIYRSPGSDMDAQGIGGTINIVLKDAGEDLQPSYLLGMGHHQRDGKSKGRAAFAVEKAFGDFALAASATLRDRHNPKRQHADIFENEDEALVKDETNVLDAREGSFNLDGKLSFVNGGVLSANIMALITDRDEIEDVIFSKAGEFEEGEFDHARHRQDNWGFALGAEIPHARGMFRLNLDHDRAELDSHSDFGVFDEGERAIEEFETDKTTDSETKLRASTIILGSAGQTLKLGLDLGRKDRDARRRTFEMGEEEIEELDNGGVFRVVETRADAYGQGTWARAKHSLQTGLRLEYTELTLKDQDKTERSLEFFPSIHYRYAASEHNRIGLSLARTVKRQDFHDLQPFVERDFPRDDQNTIGNPELKPEFAYGLDLGYEHRFAKHEGVFGLNLFYRAITDKQEIAGIAEDTFQMSNVADGEVYGLEMDVGFPLTALGAPNLSVFGNGSLQDSELTDPVTGRKRRFNLQSTYIANFGLLHFLPALKASYGLNYLWQGRAQEVLLNEEVLVGYGSNFEVLIEKRWKEGYSLRIVARNLLNAERRERLRVFDGLRGVADLKETTYETEWAGRSVQLTFRAEF